MAIEIVDFPMKNGDFGCLPAGIPRNGNTIQSQPPPFSEKNQVSDRPTPQAESQPCVCYDASSDAGTIEVWTPSAQPHSTRKDEDFS
jgi:hypothetical protein